MWRKNVHLWAPAAGAVVVAAASVGYVLWSREVLWGGREPEAPKPSQVRSDVGRKTQRLSVGAILDYADVHGTEMAQAVNRLRKHPESEDAMTEALLQYEVLGALLDELKNRQDAAV